MKVFVPACFIHQHHTAPYFSGHNHHTAVWNILSSSDRESSLRQTHPNWILSLALSVSHQQLSSVSIFSSNLLTLNLRLVETSVASPAPSAVTPASPKSKHLSRQAVFCSLHTFFTEVNTGICHISGVGRNSQSLSHLYSSGLLCYMCIWSMRV